MSENNYKQKRFEDREDIAGEHKLTDLGQIVLAVLFAVIWITDNFIFHYSDFINSHIPWYFRIFPGLILLVVSAYLSRQGLKTVFGEIRQTPGVIRKGVFKLVRHPIYLSEIILYIGLNILHISLVSIAVIVAAFIFLHLVSRHEEKLLLEKFGDDYRKYMNEVPMWIPGINKFKKK
ncbi:MAG: methyltransferase family protein [bacterium]